MKIEDKMQNKEQIRLPVQEKHIRIEQRTNMDW
jgi:hypothetical protein